ncbi:hypothetical protein M2D63_020455 [Pseudomonas sp. BJa5]|uniref:hypothetical protein n=1 Tax=Pseudomonas sp. BJa5 TaxID=2936270 RepID=UPI00255978A1|nr:hypothetical protein [Pseudomonas sp. BGr12]MDL2423485.1 hypothetical protein [Pseudomonas sp. BGr12]
MAPMRFAALPLLLLNCGPSALAYESDFHFGLTYWLAVQAGYDHQQSHDIARGDELTDTGQLDAKHAIIWQLCIRRKENASNLTRYLHFRAQQPPPQLPDARPVDHAAHFAEGQIKSVVAETGHGTEEHLLKFGQALHGRQDSFSHQGISEPHWPCPTEWIWTHAVDRGGALSHHADRTYAYPGQCLDAARSSYDWLLRYREKMNLSTSPKALSALEPQVRDFCRRQTRTGKYQWLTAQAVPQARAIAGNTSLSDGEQSFFGVAPIDLRPAAAQTDSVASAVPAYERQVTGFSLDPEADALLQSVLGSLSVESSEPARQWANAFMQAWLATPAEHLPQALAPFFGGRVLGFEDQPIDRLLRLRMTDRGLADSKDVPPGKFLGTAQGFVTADATAWRPLLVPPRGQKIPALVGNVEDGSIGLIAVLRSAPNAVLILKATPAGQGYAIDELEVQVFH